jgi:hypothetical protein
MQQAIKHGADRGDIAEQLAPVLNGTVGSEQSAETFVAAHDDFQEILGGGVRQLAHAEVVDDEQWHSGDRFHVLFACAVGDGLGQFIEQDVGFAVQHFVALLNGCLPDGLGQVAFPGSSRTQKQRVLALVDEGAGGEIENQAAIHFRIEGEVEVIECPVGIAKAGLLAAALQQPIRFAVRLAGARSGTAARLSKRCRWTGGLHAKVGGHLYGRFCGRTSPPARRPHGDSGSFEIAGRGFATNPGRLLNAPQRPSQPPQRNDLLFLFFAQDIHSTEGIPPSSLMSWALAPLAAFQVTLIGRFWVIPEAEGKRGRKGGPATAERGPEYFKRSAAMRKKRAGGRSKKPAQS